MTNRNTDPLLSFLNWLDERNVRFRLSYERRDAILVTVRTIGLIAEVEFIDGHIDISYFTGNEAVESDLNRLKATIEDLK